MEEKFRGRSAATLLGIETVPTICLEHLSKAQVQAYIIADNRLAELAGWDNETLANELQGLLEIDLNFDIEVIGFETAEIDLLVQTGAEAGEEEPADVLPKLDRSGKAITQLGDMWFLGKHRLLCGDARDATSYEALLGDERARVVFTDPPYNVPISGHVCGLGATQHPDFQMASGELSSEEFKAFLKSTLQLMQTFSLDGAIHFVCMDWRHQFELLGAANEIPLELKNLCVWNKSNGGMGGFYRSKHELVFVLKSGAAPHVNNIELGRFGRYRTNVWDYPGGNSFGHERDETHGLHPTVKPVALVADAILDCSRHGDIVLDPFCGSGSTILAAQRTGRIAHAIEVDPHYVDVAMERFERITGVVARRERDGATYSSLRQSLRQDDLEGTGDE